MMGNLCRCRAANTYVDESPVWLCGVGRGSTDAAYRNTTQHIYDLITLRHKATSLPIRPTPRR